MKPTNKLKEILAVNLSWDKKRIDCFVKMLIANCGTSRNWQTIWEKKLIWFSKAQVFQ